MVVTMMMMSVSEPSVHIERQYTHVRRIWQVTKRLARPFSSAGQSIQLSYSSGDASRVVEVNRRRHSGDA